MRTPQDEDEQPLAWQAILAETPVYSSDGEQVGIVGEVVGAEDADIFHGVVVTSGLLPHNALVPAANVTAITNRRLDTSLTAEEVRRLPQFHEEASYQLGFVGLLRRRLGWVEEGRQGP